MCPAFDNPRQDTNGISTPAPASFPAAVPSLNRSEMPARSSQQLNDPLNREGFVRSISRLFGVKLDSPQYSPTSSISCQGPAISFWAGKDKIQLWGVQVSGWTRLPCAQDLIDWINDDAAVTAAAVDKQWTVLEISLHQNPPLQLKTEYGCVIADASQP